MANRRNQRRMLSKFIQVFLTTFALLMIVVAMGTVFYVTVSQRNINTPAANPNFFGNTAYEEEQVIDGVTMTGPLKEKKMTTFAVFGVDAGRGDGTRGYRTDVTMLVFFNHETAAIDVLSVPRDTMVKIPDELYEPIKARRSDVNQVMKINEVPAYILDDRNKASVAVLEKSLGVDVDYYVNMDLDFFKKLVDMIGGVEFNVPRDMVYQDPEQDLYINLSAGQQTLYGSHAEQLVRYRKGYNNGDVGRIEMQHQFMTAFVQKLLNTKNRLNMVNIVAEAIKYVQTDFDQSVAYLTFLDDIKPDNVTMHTLPRSAEDTGGAYYIYDYDATKLLLNQIINDPYRAEAAQEQGEEAPAEAVTEPVVDVEPEEIINVKAYTVQVLNGTNISGIAGKTTTMLKEQGYKTLDADNHSEKGFEETRIMVPHKEIYEALKEHFTKPVMVLNETLLEEEAQVLVVLGTVDGQRIKNE